MKWKMGIEKTRISVRDLIEFVCRKGGLSKGFSGNKRAMIGIREHRKIQKSRPENYKSEVPVSLLVESDGFNLEIFGRIDGVFYNGDETILEEIKSTGKDPVILSRQPDDMHVAQMKCYGHMLLMQEQIETLSFQLTYVNIHTGEIDSFKPHYSSDELELFFRNLVNEYITLLKNQTEWKTLRNISIENLEFPYEIFREGQRDLSVAVFRNVRDEQILFAKAPTGTGKTIATLFPAVKALGLSQTDKIFYLTSKTIGRTVAEKALEDMRHEGLRLKSVTLTAKQKICFVSDDVCDADSCIYAEAYYGKLKHAMKEVYNYDSFNRERIEELAEKYKICPFEFSLDISLLVDVIICDLNYAFDPRVYLKRFFEFSSEKYTFLIDEAHNLSDRLRSMYSAGISKDDVLEFRRVIKPEAPKLADAAGEINTILLDMKKECQSHEKMFSVSEEVPEELFSCVKKFAYKAELWLEKNRKSENRREVSEFYFICSIFITISELFDTNYRFYVERKGKHEVYARLYCIDPSPIFSRLILRSSASVFFSATLIPVEYYKNILLIKGIKIQTILINSPFPMDNFKLYFHNRIGTSYRLRDQYYGNIAKVIETTVNSKDGNYLIFFPSYAYMDKVLTILEKRALIKHVVRQKPDMSEEEREKFLSNFEDKESITAFAVMGGIFGEGIDLEGEKLIGVVVVGVGVPQVCLEQNLIRDYYDNLNGNGFMYAYQLPGFNRVMQATGRLIRTETDRGVAVLIDERFSRRDYINLYPREWNHYTNIGNDETLKAGLFTFWNKGHGII